jgi:hypothetical protein
MDYIQIIIGIHRINTKVIIVTLKAVNVAIKRIGLFQ